MYPSFSNSSPLHPPVPASARWDKAFFRSSSGRVLRGNGPAFSPVLFCPAVSWAGSGILLCLSLLSADWFNLCGEACTLSLTGLWLCLFHNEFCVGRVIESDQRRPAKPLFLPDNEAAVFQLPEYPCDALPAAMQSFLCLFHREIQADSSVRLYVTVLFGNTCPVQQHRIQHLGIVGDVPQRLILKKKSGQRYIGSCRTSCGKFAKFFHSASLPSILSGLLLIGLMDNYLES